MYTSTPQFTIQELIIPFFIQSVLDSGGSVYVAVEVNVPNLDIPEFLRDRKVVIFEFSYHFPIPIPDLIVGNTYIEATLNFKGSPYKCFIPYESILKMTDVNSGVTILVRQQSPEQPRPTKPEKKVKPNHLRLVK